MSFDLTHLPRSFTDLVIADPLNAAIIKSYVDGPRLSHFYLQGLLAPVRQRLHV